MQFIFCLLPYTTLLTHCFSVQAISSALFCDAGWKSVSFASCLSVLVSRKHRRQLWGWRKRDLFHLICLLLASCPHQHHLGLFSLLPFGGTSLFQWNEFSAFQNVLDQPWCVPAETPAPSDVVQHPSWWDWILVQWDFFSKLTDSSLGQAVIPSLSSELQLCWVPTLILYTCTPSKALGW